MPGSSKPFRKLVVNVWGSPDKFRAMVLPKWFMTRSAHMCGLIILYIVASTSLIQFNRWLLAPERFPFPDALCITQQAVVTCVAWGLFFVKQSWFPAAGALWDDLGVAAVTKGRFFGLGAAIAFSTVCMAIAYGQCSRAVVSMIEDCTLVVMLLVTMCLGIDQFKSSTVLIVTAVFAGGLLVSFTFSPIRWTVLGLGSVIIGQTLFLLCALGQDIIMNRQQPGVMQVDPRSVVLLAAPASLLSALALFLPFHQGRNDLEPFWSPFLWYWPFLVVNGFLAVAVSVSTTYIIKNCGALGFLIVGMTNRILIAGATSLSVHGFHLIFHSHYGRLQLCGTLLATLGIAHYCLIQSHPDCFERGSQMYGFAHAYRKIFLSVDARQDKSESEISEREHLVDHA